MTFGLIVALALGDKEDGRVLHAAGSMAARFAAHVQVIPAYADPAADLVYYGTVLKRAMTSAAVRRIEDAEREAQEGISGVARRVASEAGLAFADTGVAGASIFVEKRSLNPAVATSQASALADLVLFGAEAARDRRALGGLFAATLLFDRSPILLVRTDKPILDAPIAIAWDASREAGRAVRAAIPLLAQAPSITIVQVPRGLAADQKEAASPERLAAYLAHHNKTTPKVAIVDGGREGEAILEAANREGCNLLVSGGYGRPRLQEFVLGGATRTFVEAREGPHLLLAH